MTKGTKVSTVIQKAPFVALQRLRPQDVAGLKLKSPQYRTTRTTRSSKDANDSRVKGRWLKEQDETAYKVTTPFEDGVQGATKDVERQRDTTAGSPVSRKESTGWCKIGLCIAECYQHKLFLNRSVLYFKYNFLWAKFE
ncbi:uncharacterized protein [Anabrus simplex]|uniref:uncharacterized protein n=1 Tax=Anabrus simplex TaxID=316456 RepID=UPI0035A367D4